MRLLIALLAVATAAHAGGTSCPKESSAAPKFNVPLADGGRASLNDLIKGRKAVVLSFFRYDCLPCIDELPQLQKLSAEWGDRVGVLAIHVGGPEEKMLKFLDQQKLKLPAALDAEERLAKKRYCVQGLPALFVIDGKGRVAGELRGVQSNFERDLRDLVEPLLKQR